VITSFIRQAYESNFDSLTPVYCRPRGKRWGHLYSLRYRCLQRNQNSSGLEPTNYNAKWRTDQHYQ